MWIYNGKVMRAGRSWRDSSGTLYPTQWYARTTDAEKTAVGWVWQDDPVKYDNRFYTGDGTAKDLNTLKATAIEFVKKQAGSLLTPTDWYIVREQETGEVTPTDILNYRQAVRTASGTIETAITGATTHAEFMALYDAPVDANNEPTGNAPINDWPEEL